LLDSVKGRKELKRYIDNKAVVEECDFWGKKKFPIVNIAGKDVGFLIIRRNTLLILFQEKDSAGYYWYPEFEYGRIGCIKQLRYIFSRAILKEIGYPIEYYNCGSKCGMHVKCRYYKSYNSKKVQVGKK
jgi:hypothetical protein